MASLIYSEAAIEDLVRLTQFLGEDDEGTAEATSALIRDALTILEAHPLIGRPIPGEWRELVISRGRSGYLAIYEYQSMSNRVIVHGIRHQRETGFDDD